MLVTSRKEADELTALAHALAPSARSGITVPELVAAVPIRKTRAERLLRRYCEYFVNVGGTPKYALNRFSRFEGSEERIIADVERCYRHYKMWMISGTVLALLASLISIAGPLLRLLD